MDEQAKADEERRQEWHRYYSEKRILHQWRQTRLLADVPVRKVLEVGPYLGLVTAMLENAGYDVTTLDLFPPLFARPATDHIEADLTALSPDRITGFDAILCCETLEHLAWDKTSDVLDAFARSSARYLVVSVPYNGFQMHLSLYWNRWTFRQHAFWRIFKHLREFTPEEDPHGHKWEIGYRDFPLKAWERTLAGAGWRIVKREFSYPTRSVFHFLENAAA